MRRTIEVKGLGATTGKGGSSLETLIINFSEKSGLVGSFKIRNKSLLLSDLHRCHFAQMVPLPPLFLASIDAMRPVFLMVMGMVLLLVAWRLTRRHRGWSARMLMAGALLLAFGYGVILPLYEAEVIVPLRNLSFYPDVDPATTLGWHVSKVFAMNGGWLLFGLGMALHAGLFERERRPSQEPEIILP